MNRKPRKKKLPLGIDEDFLLQLSNMTEQELKERIVSLQSSIRESQDFLKENPVVLAAKEEYDLVKAPVNDTITACRNKNKYVLEELSLRGKL